MKMIAPYIPYIYLAIAVAAEVVATTALKASDTLSKPVPSAIMVVGYIITFLFMSLVMRSLPVGITYALWSGLGIIPITIASIYLFGEILDLPAIIGIGMIICGIIVIQTFSKMNING